MEIQKDVFCSNHSKKHAKKHCNQCNLDLCNECALDQHISHYKSLQKIDYSSKKNILNLSDMLCEEIRKILNNSFDDMTIKVYKNVQEKALNYMKSYPKNEPKKINIVKNEINKENKKFNDVKYKYNELTNEKQNVIQKYIKEIDNLYENEANFEKNLEKYKKLLKDIENIINTLKNKNDVFKNRIQSIKNESHFYYINTIKDKLYNNSLSEQYKLKKHEDILNEIINSLKDITNNTYNNNLEFQIFTAISLIYKNYKKILTLKIKTKF